MPRQRGRRGAGSIVRRGGKYRATWSTTDPTGDGRNAIGVLQSSSAIPTIPSVEPRAILDRAVGRPVTSGRRPLVDE